MIESLGEKIVIDETGNKLISKKTVDDIGRREIGQLRRKPTEVRLKEKGREVRRIDLTREEICETIGVCLETNDNREKALVELNPTTQWKLVTQMKSKSKENKRLGKRSVEEEKKTNKDKGKKKKGEEEENIEVEEEKIEEVNMEINSEVSKEKEDSDITILNKEREGDKEKENNVLYNTQDNLIEISKRARMVNRNGKMIYEDMVIGEGEKKNSEDKCYKSDHRGEILVQARIVEKYISRNRMSNLLKIAREVNKEKIKAKGIRSCGLAAAEIRFSNIIEANKCQFRKKK